MNVAVAAIVHYASWIIRDFWLRRVISALSVAPLSSSIARVPADDLYAPRLSFSHSAPLLLPSSSCHSSFRRVRLRSSNYELEKPSGRDATRRRTRRPVSSAPEKFIFFAPLQRETLGIIIRGLSSWDLWNWNRSIIVFQRYVEQIGIFSTSEVYRWIFYFRFATILNPGNLWRNPPKILKILKHN